MTEYTQLQKNIAVIYQGQYPTKGGKHAGTRRVCDIANGLASNKSTIELWVPAHFENHPPSGLDRFSVRRLGIDANSPNLSRRRVFWQSVSQELKTRKPIAAIFYNTTFDSVFAMRAAKKEKITVAYELCDRFSTSANSLKRKMFHLFGEWLLPKTSNLNIVISKSIESWVKRIAPKTPAMIVPGLVDVNAFKKSEADARRFRETNNIQAGDFLLAYGGSWCRHKGLPILVSAFEQFEKLIRKEANIKLTISGNPTIGNNTDDMRAYVRSKDLSSKVIFPGNLQEDEIVGMLTAADVVVSPSLDHEFSRNAFPTKVAEYAAMGKAIVATDVGEIPHYFKAEVNAMLCKPNEPASMADQFVRLFRDRDLLSRIEIEARLTALRHFEAQAATSVIVKKLFSF